MRTGIFCSVARHTAFVDFAKGMPRTELRFRGFSWTGALRISMPIRKRTLDFGFITSRNTAGLRVKQGLRSALGPALALGVGLMASQELAGLAVAIGAQVAGFAGLNGTARRRLRTTLSAALWMGVTTFVGGITGGTWVALPIIAVLGFLAGLLVCVSLEAGLIGMWATIAFVFIDGMHQSAHQGLARALLVAAGALLQMVLMVIFDATSRTNAETQGVVAVYRSIANYVQDPSLHHDLLVAGALLEADSRLRDSFLSNFNWSRLRVLTDLAESIRIETIALVGWERDLVRSSLLGETDTQRLKAARRHIGAGLSAVSEALTRNESNDERVRAQDWEEAVSQLSTAQVGEERSSLQSEWNQAVLAISHVWIDLNQAKSVVFDEVASKGLFSGRLASSPRMPPFGWVRDAFEAIRVNLGLQSSAFRHAVRLGLTLCAATLIYRISPIPRGYWLALTALVILRPEFSTTFTRGIARVLGTLLGALFATLLVSIPDPGHWLGVLLVGVFLWGMYSVLNYNLVLFTCFLTAEVAVLLSYFEDVPPVATIADRIIYTVAGSLLAWLAYMVWPTWQHKNVPLAFANLIAAEREYLRAVLTPEKRFASRVEIAKWRKRTRLARTNAVNLVNQSALEPFAGRLRPRAQDMALTALHRLSEGLMVLESRVFSKDSAGHVGLPDITRFVEFMDAGLARVETEMRHGGAIEPFFEDFEGMLDEVGSLTKREILEMQLPAPWVVLFVRMADNMATLYRTLSPKPTG